MKKARLGFKIASLDGELLVEEDKDFERRVKDKVWRSRQRELKRKLKCYHKHNSEYNKQRRDRYKTVEGQYAAAKKDAKGRLQPWDLTQEEWEDVWIEAGFVRIPGTQTPSNPEGRIVTAYSLRGGNKYENTMMARLDLNEGWSKENCYITYMTGPLVGSRYHISA